MKTKFVFHALSLSFILFLVPEIIEGQVISLNELIRLSKCKNFSCTSEIVLTKGFSLVKTDNSNKEIFYSFASDRKFHPDSSPMINVSNKVDINLSERNYSTVASFETSLKSQYQKLLSELASAGFKATETDGALVNNGLVTFFKSPKHPELLVTMVTNRYDKPGIGSWSAYNLIVVSGW
jgi:hypothetical protein